MVSIMSDDEIPKPVENKDDVIRGKHEKEVTKDTRSLYSQVKNDGEKRGIKGHVPTMEKKGRQETLRQRRIRESLHGTNQRRNNVRSSRIKQTMNSKVKKPLDHGEHRRQILKKKIKRLSDGVQHVKFGESKGMKKFQYKWNHMRDMGNTSFKFADKVRLPRMRGLSKKRFNYGRKMRKMKFKGF